MISCPGHRATIWPTDAGRDLGLSLLLQLHALPVPVDDRVELLRIFGDPDLLANHEVLRIKP